MTTIRRSAIQLVTLKRRGKKPASNQKARRSHAARAAPGAGSDGAGSNVRSPRSDTRDARTRRRSVCYVRPLHFQRIVALTERSKGLLASLALFLTRSQVNLGVQPQATYSRSCAA